MKKTVKKIKESNFAFKSPMSLAMILVLLFQSFNLWESITAYVISGTLLLIGFINYYFERSRKEDIDVIAKIEEQQKKIDRLEKDLRTYIVGSCSEVAILTDKYRIEKDLAEAFWNNGKNNDVNIKNSNGSNISKP